RCSVLGKKMRLNLPARKTGHKSPRPRARRALPVHKGRCVVHKGALRSFTQHYLPETPAYNPNNPGIPIIELREASCRAIISREGEPVRYCGEPKVEFSWCCPHHYSRFYIPART